MTLSRIIAAGLALAALVPATAGAASGDVDLKGAPTLRLVDARHATLEFAVDERLAGKRARITFAGGQKVSRLKAAGRHGRDFVYTARVTAVRDLRVGTKYTVRFRFAGQGAVKRLVTLKKAS